MGWVGERLHRQPTAVANSALWRGHAKPILVAHNTGTKQHQKSAPSAKRLQATGNRLPRGNPNGMERSAPRGQPNIHKDNGKVSDHGIDLSPHSTTTGKRQIARNAV
jgi:hypothetical protein